MESYRHLARRGDELEFGDGTYLIRQMVRRRRRLDFVGRALRAQDFHDAAELLRWFYRDLTGRVLPDPGVMAISKCSSDFGLLHAVRNRLLGHEPKLTYGADDAKRVLGELGHLPARRSRHCRRAAPFVARCSSTPPEVSA